MLFKITFSLISIYFLVKQASEMFRILAFHYSKNLNRTTYFSTTFDKDGPFLLKNCPLDIRLEENNEVTKLKDFGKIG